VRAYLNLDIIMNAQPEDMAMLGSNQSAVLSKSTRRKINFPPF
jgi:hypothetical protein